MYYLENDYLAMHLAKSRQYELENAAKQERKALTFFDHLKRNRERLTRKDRQR